MSGPFAPTPSSAPSPRRPNRTGLPDRDLALKLYRERRHRDLPLRGGEVAMGEQARDILFVLYMLDGVYRPLTQGDVAGAAAMPETVVAAELVNLVDAGLIGRGKAGIDPVARKFVLTDDGVALVGHALAAVRLPLRTRVRSDRG